MKYIIPKLSQIVTDLENEKPAVMRSMRTESGRNLWKAERHNLMDAIACIDAAYRQHDDNDNAKAKANSDANDSADPNASDADSEPTALAKQGAEPVPGAWPEPQRPTPPQERRTYPGEGLRLVGRDPADDGEDDGNGPRHV